MNAQVSLSLSDQAADREFARELASVRDRMVEPIRALSSPLRDLILAQIESSLPATRGALVLCAGYSLEQNSTESRVNLAAALEMLTVALGIHEHLLDANLPALPADPGPEERTYLGGNILAGDLCFSCAAQLAARTDSPAVVAIFATALQTVSENRLRKLFREQDGTSIEPTPPTNVTLMQSGSAAALELSDLNASDRLLIGKMIESLIGAAATSRPLDSGWQKRLHGLPAEHVSRWQAYGRWILKAVPHPSSR